MRDPALTLPEPPPELAALSERLCTRIGEKIESAGPISFARYMQMALYEPGLGYYVNGLHRFGAGGDFVTAPEQGGLFAAGIARQLDEVALAIGPDWTLLEIGPGSGALARDLLTGLKTPPARCLLLEPSAPLRQVQAETLADLPDELAARVEWIAAPPEKPFAGAILANEVADALPVARFRITFGKPEELGVARGNAGFQWQTRPAPDRLRAAVEAVLSDVAEPLPDGYESELCLDLSGWLETVTRPLKTGLVLLVDYGYPRREYYHPDRSGGTLVCHYRHRAHFDPFVWPGLTDISAFVEFTALAEAAEAAGLEVAGFTTQAGFLLGSGLHERIEAEKDGLRRLQLAGEFKRLVLPGEMGEKFKVMALSRQFDVSSPAFGFADHLARL